MIRIENTMLDALSDRAKTSARLRMNLNFHKEPADTLQRLLNAMEPGTYIQPHKHESPDKREIFFALRGRILVVEFHPDGNILESIVLDPFKGKYGAEIAPRTFHSLIALEPGSVVYEFKDGPYDPIDDKNFAHWAPSENDPGVRDYLRQLVENCLGKDENPISASDIPESQPYTR
ncbi:MAG TPA: WbuC family cupin fold metalloprotein [Bacteroidales bacterium]|nr:WbuC family cupin fold metalloprotein [Bacteroidales bacterium]HPT09035.1 WbuC family cupin fold metalloprotein [Bacteroidales bacterium]